MLRFSFVALALLVASGCTSSRVDIVRADGPIEQPSAFDHGMFDDILKAHVDEDGLVDYAALQASDALTPYLRRLATTDPGNLPEDDRLAFWLNTYNALTLKLIVDHYPTESILRLSPVGIKGLPFLIPKINTPFKVDVGEVGGEVVTLDHVEHGIIRERFDEPRIHFALVCAALSCPPLRAEAYVGDRLNAQLDDQARVYLDNPDRNQIPSEEGVIRVSKIFKWFDEDFGGSDATLQQFLARYYEGDLRSRLEAGAFNVKHMDYKWSLNDQARFANDNDTY
ncbi:MAG: DUF547 domain-containing protein [Rhodothermales bacterium]